MSTPAMSESFKPARTGFWTRDFILALTAYFFLYLSMTLFYIYPLFFQKFGTPQGRVGLIMGVHSLLAILVRPVFGRIIDARGGRRIALWGILFFMAILPLFHLVQDAGWLPFVLRAATGIAWGVSITATMVLCSDLAPPDRLAHSIGIIGVAGIIGSAVGPWAGEEIIRRFGFGRLYDAGLIFLVIALLCVWATRGIWCPQAEQGKAKAHPLRGIPARLIFVAAMMPIFHGAIRGSIVNFIALFAKSAGLGRVGPFFAVFSIAAIMTRLVTGDLSDRFGRKAVIWPAAAIIGLNLFWISQVRSYPMFLVNGFVAGLGQGLIFPAMSTYIVDTVGVANKAFALSLYMSLFDTGMGLGSPFFGGIADSLGYRNMYIVAGGLLLLSTTIFLLRAPKTGGPGSSTPLPAES
jgi:MFS family permease